ncbi:MAG: GspE/PulE family protein [Vulcanimicrobiaceae bacterium]
MALVGHGTSRLVDLSGIALEPEAIRRIPRQIAMRHDVLSIASDGNQLTVAIPDVDDQEALDHVALATGMHIQAVRASRQAIRARLAAAYGAQRTDEAPAVRVVDAIHERAVSASASDVHIEPSRNGGRVRQRVDGILHEVQRLPDELFTHVVSRVKLLAGMDIADKRAPQDGRYEIDMLGRSIDARVSSMPTIFGEKLVIRLLDHHAQVPSLEHLGMPDKYLERYRRTIHAPHGFVVVCGPTGSGKTTTLYATLAERNLDSQSLCSVEDPVEIRIPGVAQVQVNARAGVTFASALRAFLRQDPNVIMVGEMRDEETASVAVSAALSGQLVLTTLHSNDAPRTLERLLELGLARHSIAAGLTGIIAQRLVRRLCSSCRVWSAIDSNAAATFGISDATHAYAAVGCSQCEGTGYRGRTGIFELLFVDDAVRDAIANGASSVHIAALARAGGYEPLLADGVRRVLAGETSFVELHRVVSTGISA